jgi:hypothetical protein
MTRWVLGSVPSVKNELGSVPIVEKQPVGFLAACHRLKNDPTGA